jgi:hypothetical protein
MATTISSSMDVAIARRARPAADLGRREPVIRGNLGKMGAHFNEMLPIFIEKISILNHLPIQLPCPFSAPPIFSARDYGRLVECTTPYEAQSENQLSLGIGQRIMLVKNGTRGWVLARSEHGERLK